MKLSDGESGLERSKLNLSKASISLTTTVRQQVDDNQNELKIEKLKAEVESLKSKIADRDRIIESKDKGIQVQDDSIAMQTKENKELKVAIEQIGTKLVYARRPAERKFVDYLSFRG